MAWSQNGLVLGLHSLQLVVSLLAQTIASHDLAELHLQTAALPPSSVGAFELDNSTFETATLARYCPKYSTYKILGTELRTFAAGI